MLLTPFSFSAPAAPQPAAPGAQAYAFSYAGAAAILAADQCTKYLVHEFTPYGWVHPVTAFFNLVHARNFGAAFSFLADAGGWQRYLFGLLALAVAVWLAWMLRKPLPWPERVAYVLILGGALGNGLDRALRGYVVDFLDFHARGWHWPAFNVADMAIVGGAALLVWTAWARPPAPDAGAQP